MSHESCREGKLFYIISALALGHFRHFRALQTFIIIIVIIMTQLIWCKKKCNIAPPAFHSWAKLGVDTISPIHTAYI